MAASADETLVEGALRMALSQRRPQTGLTDTKTTIRWFLRCIFETRPFVPWLELLNIIIQFHRLTTWIGEANGVSLSFLRTSLDARDRLTTCLNLFGKCLDILWCSDVPADITLLVALSTLLWRLQIIRTVFLLANLTTKTAQCLLFI